MISSVFNTILYQPILNLFVWLYNVLPGHDVGLVIFVMTVLVRLALYPLTSSSIKAQKSMQELQPKLAEIKKMYAKDQQAQAQATMELYKNHKINPFASCLPMLIQLPILIALYAVFRDGLASNGIGNHLYPFIADPGMINPVSLGAFNLSLPNYILAVLAGAAQFLQAWTMSRKQPPKTVGTGGKDEDMMAMMNKQMLYVVPIMTIIFGIKLPAGLTVYWLLSTLLMIVQQWIISKKVKPSSSATQPSAPSVSATSSTNDKKVIEGEIIK